MAGSRAGHGSAGAGPPSSYWPSAHSSQPRDNRSPWNCRRLATSRLSCRRWRRYQCCSVGARASKGEGIPQRRSALEHIVELRRGSLGEVVVHPKVVEVFARIGEVLVGQEVKIAVVLPQPAPEQTRIDIGCIDGQEVHRVEPEPVGINVAAILIVQNMDELMQ